MPDPTINLIFDGRGAAPGIRRAEIRQGNGKHTLALVDVKVQNTNTPAIAENTPAYLDWGHAPNSIDRFYGYVHHSQLVSTSVGTARRYVLIGTSEPMNVVRTRTWKSVTASAIARQVFTEHKLRSIITPHSRLLNFYAQSGISDFSVLADLAKQTGFRCWVDGATGYFVDPTVLLKGPRANSVPTFTQNQVTGFTDTLKSLNVLTGTKVPRGDKTVAGAIVFGLDKRSGTIIKATSANGAAGSTILSQAVDDFSDAQGIADAATLGNRNWITAEALVVGTTLCAPGRLATFNGNALQRDMAGLWFIDSAVHVISRLADQATFESTLQISRDHQYGVTTRTSADLTKNGEIIPATLRNGKTWEASLLEQINVG